MCDFGWNGLGWIALAIAVLYLIRSSSDNGCGCQNGGGSVGGCGGCGGCR